MSLESQLTLAFQAVAAIVKKHATTTQIPPSGGGWYMEPQGVLGSAAGTVVKGKVQWVPIDIAPKALVSSGYLFNISTAFSSGVGAGLIVGVYQSDVSGLPDIATGPLCQATYDLSGSVTTGIKQKTWTGGNYTFKPGRYWIGALYTWTTTVPTTGAITCYSNTTFRLPTVTALAPGSALRSLCTNVSTFTALPTSGVTFSNSGNVECPAIGLIAA